MKVKILQKMTVALDDLGFRLAYCVRGDVVDLSDEHGSMLVGCQAAEAVASDVPVTVQNEKKTKPAGKARSARKTEAR